MFGVCSAAECTYGPPYPLQTLYIYTSECTPGPPYLGHHSPVKNASETHKPEWARISVCALVSRDPEGQTAYNKLQQHAVAIDTLIQPHPQRPVDGFESANKHRELSQIRAFCNRIESLIYTRSHSTRMQEIRTRSYNPPTASATPVVQHLNTNRFAPVPAVAVVLHPYTHSRSRPDNPIATCTYSRNRSVFLAV